jgi:hypothetical protein
VESMTAAYIEHRPKASDPEASTSYFVIVAGGREHGRFKTQKEAKDRACNDGYRPVHVALVRHLQDRRLAVDRALSAAKLQIASATLGNLSVKFVP